MCSNVLPSAPQEEPSLYPQLPQHDFRMQKANEVSAALNAEVFHYRSVAKKYKRAKKAANGTPPAAVRFQLYFHLRVLPRLYQSSAFQLQFRSAESVGLLLLLLQS